MSRRALAITVIVIVTVVAGGLWLLGRDATLQWAAERAQARASGRLAIVQPHGSLLSRVRAERVTWRGDSNTIESEDIEVSWSPLWLLIGTVAFDKIHARTLDVTSTATQHEPLKLPEKLSLPVRLRFDDATVERLSVVNVDGEARTFAHVVLSVATGPKQWAAKLGGMQTTWGTLRGKAAVGTASPFSLDASLTLQPEGRAAPMPPISLKADAKGNLSAFDLDVDAKVQTSTANAKLKIEPLAPLPVSAIEAALHAVDARHLFADAPETVLDGKVEAVKDADGTLRGSLDVANSAAGTVDRRRIPIVKLTSQLVATPQRWWLEALVIDAGAAGKLTGTGWLTAAETGFVLLADGVDLHGVHPGLRATHLAGNLHSSGPFERQQMRVALADRDVAFAGDAVYQPDKVTVSRVNVRAGAGRFEASGSLALDAQHAFSVKTSFAGFDPSQVSRLKRASINGKITASGELAPVLHVRADGSLSSSTLFGLPVAAEGRWASKGVGTDTIAFDVKATLGETRVTARGGIKDPTHLRAVDIALDLGGADMQQLYTITGLPFPSTPAYRITGNLGLRDNVWSLRGFNGSVGRSDLSGDFVVDVSRERPFVRADLTSQRLDMKDLGGFIGHDYNAPEPAPDKVLPQLPFKLDKLNAANVDLKLTGRSFRNERLPLHRLSAHLKLDGGRVTVDPLSFRAAGGDIDARVAMDARRAPIRAAVDMRARNLQLNRLAPGVKAVLASAGTIDGRIELAMTGNSSAQMLGSADGQVVVAMNGGAVSDLALRLANLDVANALVALARGDREIPLRCAVAYFAAENGVLRPRTLVVDTEHTVLKGEGAINLGTEELALRLIAEPKDASLFSLRGPIRIDGTLKDPAIHPELGNMIARSGAAVALASVATPFAAMIPFMQLGTDQNVDCAPLIVDANRFIHAASRAATQNVATQ